MEIGADLVVEMSLGNLSGSWKQKFLKHPEIYKIYVYIYIQNIFSRPNAQNNEFSLHWRSIATEVERNEAVLFDIWKSGVKESQKKHICTKSQQRECDKPNHSRVWNISFMHPSFICYIYI